VTGPDSAGRVDTSTFVWTPQDSSQIYLDAVDSAVFHGGFASAQMDSLHRGQLPYFDALGVGSVGETSRFAPGTGRGWRVTFPSSPLWSAKLEGADPCRS